MCLILTRIISTTIWRIYKTLLRQMMMPFSNMQLPTIQKWSYYLWYTLVQCDEEMSATYLNLIAYTTNLEVELDCTICNIQLWGEIDESQPYLTSPIAWSTTSCDIICFASYIFCSCKGLEMMGSDKIHTASCTYIHVLSLCHLYPLPVTWRIQMRTFKRYISHAVFSQLYT
jgi:hypothetical protein